MNINVLQQLKKWRDATAKKEGVENYRVIPNSAIEEIAILLPRSKAELTSIKGIKDKKFYKYGHDIFEIIKNASNTVDGKHSDYSNPLFFTRNHNMAFDYDTKMPNKNKIYSISDYLNFLNERLFESGRVQIKGEIISVDEREKVTYFSLKDPEGESVINCLIFRYNFEISGITLTVGNEVVITAVPEIYKPTGRLSMKVSLIEISGEGLLKKSYDQLKSKLEKEGIFSLERKKVVPKLPRVIGLITSNQGAAIGDFMTNIGNYGFKIKFINTSVEGKQAIFDLMSAVDAAKELRDLDVLAIVRGGGSLESLQAFNNESLVRLITTVKVPVVCGVGHEKDESLVSLASDVAVSTPTAAAFAIRESWDNTISSIEHSKDVIFDTYGKILIEHKLDFENNIKYGLQNSFRIIEDKFDNIIDDLRLCKEKLSGAIASDKEKSSLVLKGIISKYDRILHTAIENMKLSQSIIMSNDPHRQLRLGYSISYSEGKIIRSINDVNKNSTIRTRLNDGTLDSIVKNKTSDKL